MKHFKMKSKRFLALFLSLILLLPILSITSFATNECLDIDEGLYYIQSGLDSNKVLDIHGISKNAGANAEICGLNEGLNQIYYIRKNGNYYMIIALHSGQAVDVYGASRASKTNVCQWPADSNDIAQQWEIQNAGNGYVYFRSVLGTYLDVQGGETSDGTNVWAYSFNGTKAQQWRLVPVNTEVYDLDIQAPETISITPGSSHTSIIKFSGSGIDKITATITGSGLSQKISDVTWKAYPNTCSATFTLSASKEFKNAELTVILKAKNGGIIHTEKINVVAASSNSSTTQSNRNKDYTLPVNMNLIKQTGKQKASGSCFCYALAYARDILDNKVHSWTEYDSYHGANGESGAYANRRLANFNLGEEKTDKARIFEELYNTLRNGKPVVINVNKGRSSGEHFILLVGYQNVTNPKKLSESNFIMIDSVKGTPYAPENVGTVGYRLKLDSGRYWYYIP